MADSVCPVCNSALKKVIWNAASCPEEHFHEIAEDENVVLGGLREGSRREGKRICLHCKPQWRRVDQLVEQHCRWQYEKEHAVEARNFVEAGRFKDLQLELRQELQKLLDELE